MPVASRRCVLGQGKLVNKCTVNLKSLCKSMSMKGRLEQAMKKIKEDPEDDELWKEMDEPDQERKKCMLKAEKECRMRCAGRVPHSEMVNEEGAHVCFHKLAIKSKGRAATRASNG